MMRNMLIAKIHRAVVTARNVDYVGSISLDPDLIEAARILPWELVHIADVDNGARLETYVIPGERGKGEVQLNGAAAHLVNVGDRIIIMAYGLFNPDELIDHHPRVIMVNNNNQVTEAREL